ncbi:MAG: histidine phosphatase family protein [Bacteroidales bacterium]|nr:histidine phosphatase family protein [Bacteroidales bacterium]
MLTLVLVRHGEAGYGDGEDFERRLTARGKNQALNASLLLKGWGISPEIFIASDAVRAKETAQIMAEQVSERKTIVYEHFLYEAYTTDELLGCLSQKAQESKTVALVAHNPDITYKASNLAAEALPCSFPTAGLLVLQFEDDDWANVSARSGRIAYSSFL